MIVITEFMDEAAIRTLKAAHDVVYDPTLADDPPQIPALMHDARALIVRNRTQVTADLLSAAPRLQIVGRLGVGLDNIDLAACTERGIEVAPATGANANAVAEYVVGTALVLLRRAYLSRDLMEAGKWPRQECQGHELSGRTLGLVGFGTIARTTARLARAFSLRIVAFDPFVGVDDDAWQQAERADLETLLQAADVVSLHVPLNDKTRNLIDFGRLSLMKPGAVLINSSRGGIVDEEALAAALKEGRLAGAALDVFDDEPLTTAGAARFEGVRNLILTPHIAGVTVESSAEVSRVTAENVLRKLGG